MGRSMLIWLFLVLLGSVVWAQSFVFLSTHSAVVGEQVIAVGVLYRLDTNQPLVGKRIVLQISDDNSLWSDVGSCVTGEDGSCSVPFVADAGYWYVRFYFAGDDQFMPSFSNVEELNVLHLVSLDLSVSSTSVRPGEQFELTVFATVDGSPAQDLNVRILRSVGGAEYSDFGWCVTDVSGVCSVPVVEVREGTYYYYALFEGNATYAGAVSSVVEVSVLGSSASPSAGGGAGAAPVGTPSTRSVGGVVSPAAPISVSSVGGAPFWLFLLVVLGLLLLLVLVSRRKR